MTSDVAALAVLLRKTQWLLDDVAFEVAAGRGAEADLPQVASALEEVALLLRLGDLPPSRMSSAGGEVPGARPESP